MDAYIFSSGVHSCEKDVCLEEIGLLVQNVVINIPSLMVNIIEGTSLGYG